MAHRSSPIRVILFFTRGVSLKTWDRSGVFDRETALYRRLAAQGAEICFVTYGDRSDLGYASRLPGIRILCNRWGLPQRNYVSWLPILHGASFFRPCILKSNQTKGADTVLRVARFWRKPMIARCGYMWSDLTAHGGPGRQAESRRAEEVERTVFNAAQKVVVTTRRMRGYVENRYGIPRDKTRIIPNFVFTDRFAPDGRPRAAKRILYVGRLNPEKNPLAVVEACAGMGVELVMAGEGPMRDDVAGLADRLQIHLTLLGQVDHERLPDIYGRATAFVLASPHEGHPKTLLEAMSCGLPVIGNDAPGIREIIAHKENGLMFDGSAQELQKAIRTVLDDGDLRETMGRNARTYVLERFALERVAGMEMGLLRQMTKTSQLNR